MSADTSGDVSHIQDEDVLRKMWQDTEDFGKKKEIRSHMYKLREERLRNFYSSSDSSTDIQRTQSTPGLHDKSAKEGNGPTHADSLADHSFLSLKSKEIRDSESPTREMHYRVDKTRGGDQGWNVVTKNETSPDGKTHSTSRVATTSGTDKIDGGVANYAAKCEQKASVYNDGDDKNFTKSVASSSRNVIHQEAKGGDDNSNFQSFSTSSSSASKVVAQHRSTTGDATDFKALPSNVDDSSSTTVIRRTYTTDVPAELKNSPNYIDANTKVTTETRTLPDGTKVTTTRYETKGGKTVSTSSADHHTTSSKQMVSEQKSSTVKSSSSKTETQSSNRTIQDSRNVHDDVDRNRIVNQTHSTQIVRQVPVNYDDTDRTMSVQVIRSTNDDVNQNVSQSVNKTSSSSVNIQKSHKVVDSRNVDVNVESNRIVQTKDIRDTRNDAIKQIQDVERNVDVRQEFVTTKDNVVKTHTSKDVHGAHQDDVRTIRVIQENEYLPRDKQPDIGRIPKDNRTTSTTVRQEVVTTRDGTVKKTTTQDVRGSTTDDVRIVKSVQEHAYSPRDTHPVVDRVPKDQQTSTTVIRKEVITRGDTTQNIRDTTQSIRDTTQDDVRIARVIQENEYLPRDTRPDLGRKPIDQQPSTGHHETVTTRREVTTTNKTENIPITTHDDVHITRIIQENEYLPRGKQPGVPADRAPVPSTPGDRTPIGRTPGDRTPAISTPGIRTPALSTPGDRTPVGRAPGDRTPALQEVVCQLVPQNERPDQYTPKGQHPPDTHDFYTTKTTTTVTTNIDNKTGDRKVVTDDFINKERTHIIDTKSDQREPSPKYEKPKPGQREPSPNYETPEKREPIRPGKSELDEKPTPTDGQYQTTYRTDYVNKRISVDVSPTHDAFARSLRAISPDRDKKRGSTRSLKSSTSSLRSSTSPEKYPTDRRQPARVSPDRKPDSRGTSPIKKASPDRYTPESKVCYPRRSPTKQTPNDSINTDTITRRHRDEIYTTVSKSSPERKPVKPDTINYDTITRTKHTGVNDTRRVITKTTDHKENIDSSTLTRRPKDRPRSRSTSPTSIASDIEFVKSNEIITDLDDETITSTTNRTDIRRDTTEKRHTVTDDVITDKRPTSLDVTTIVTTKKTKKITDRSPTSPLADFSSPTRKSPVKDKPQDKPFKRRDTYEDRCRQILGISDKTTVDKNVTEVRKTTKTKIDQTSSTTPRKPSTDGFPRSPSKSPEKIRSPTKDIQEFPSQIRRSPEKQPLEKVPRRTSPTKNAPKIQEFPSQIRRSPEKEPLQKPSEKCRPTKEKPKVQEFPSQIRRSPEKQPLEKLPEKSRPGSYVTKIQEFPSQIRRSPEKQPLERPPEKCRPTKQGPKVQEFPSQIRRSPERQQPEKYPEKIRATKERPTVDEYPSQTKRVPGLGRAPGEADEPLFTKKFVSTLCREEEVERSGVRKTTTERKSPERTLPREYITPSDTDSDQPHKTVKKDSPEKTLKEYPSQRGPKETSPERKQPSVHTTFIDTERADTDITITEYEKDSRRPRKPDRVSPDRKTTTERYDTDKRITTTDVTEYTDEYRTPEGYRPFKPDRKSPTRIPLSSEEKSKRPTQPGRVSPDRKSPTRSPLDSEITRRTKITEVTQYTDEDKRRPLQPERISPSGSPDTTRRTKTTVYTDQYNTVITSDDDKPSDRRPERKSPERVRGVTEYTDEYRSTDKRNKTTTDRITKVTSKSTRPTEPGDDEETTDSEVDSTTRKITDNYNIKETRTTVTNGNIPKRTVSPSKPGITEYPSQKPKPGKTTPKTTRITSTVTRKNNKEEKISLCDIENVRNVEVDDKVNIRTHRIDDYYTNKTTKTLTNGDTPKSKTIPKRNEPKSTKPGITEYPSQKTPDHKKPLADRPGKPVKETPERKIPKRPDSTKIVYSPYDKPRSPDRYSPSKQVTDRERIHTTTVTRKIATKNITDTYESKPKSKTPTRQIQRQPEQQPSTKRHVVTTTIQVTPKTRPEGPRKPLQKTTVAHTTIERTSRLSQPKTVTAKIKPGRPTENGRVTTEEDSETDYEVMDEITDTRRVTEDTCKTTRRTDSKITRTISDQVIKTPRRVPVRGQSKPELVTSKPTRPTDGDRPSTKTGKKIITTKSITINNDFDDEKEIIVNLQRSTSSREPTPDRIYPRPALADEDTGIPRYPDQISEPDEPRTRRKLTKLSDIPIIESEDSRQFTRITEYDDTEVTRRVNKVEKTDECLLSVNQKVSKFVDEAERLTKKPQKPLSPTRRSPRPDIVVDETTETDQSYRTVSEKLNKFVNTSEHLSTRQRIPERPKSPKCKNYPDNEVDDEQFTSVSKKVSHFIETAEKVKHPQKPILKDGPAPKVKRPEFSDVDENIKTDDCLLSVSDKVNKFTTVHKLQSPDYKKPVSLAKIDITPKRESPTRESPRRESPRRESPLRESPRRESPRRESPRRESPRRESPRREMPRRDSPSGITTECVQIDSEEQTYIRRPSPDRYSPMRRESSPRPYTDEKTPTRPSNRQTTVTKTDVQQSKYIRKDSLIREPDSTPKSSRKDDEPRSVLSPTGRLRSTESIRKAKELFENIAKEQKTTRQRDIISRPSVFEGRKPKQPDDDRCTIRTTNNEDVKLTDIGVYNIRTSDTKSRNISTKLRYSSDEDIETTDTTRRTMTNTYNKDDHLKSTRLIMDKVHRPRSPEKDGDVPGYLRPLDRSPRPHSPYYDRSRSPKPDSDSPSRERSPRPHDPSLDEIPHYMWPLDRTLRDNSSDRDRSRSRSREPTPDIHGRIRSRTSTPDRDIPGYMKPLDRHARPTSPYRKSTNELDGISRKHPVEDTDRTTKFGVTLRRTDSGRAATTTTTTTTTSQRRKLTAVEIERILTTQEIEEIYDIEILEILLERAVSYEQRRRVRSQIRIVKQLIADNKLTIVTSKKTPKTVSPTRDAPKTRGKSPAKPMQTDRRPSDKSRTEYQTEYVRKVSPSRKTIDNKHYQHTDIVTKRSDVERKSEYQTSYAYNERRTSSEVKTHVRGASPETKVIRGKSPEKAPRRSITTVETITRRSPERKTEKTETRSVYKTELRRTAPVTKSVVEEKPSWVTQRSLKKPSDAVPSRKTSSTTTTTKKQISSRTSPMKECKPTDVITSSYGVGPTDENGTPLFGLRALRAQNRTDTTKVQGTVIRSHYYSENGQEPTGEVSVTKYSTDPRDLDGNVEERNGLVSVTTTQKFGTKGTPSYKTIIDKKQITDLDDEECETVTRKSTTTKVSRRGSVKEMSKKFVANAVETSKNERQSSYPKAGLILRTSSFKDTAKSGSSRESSPEKHESVSRTVTVKKTTSSSSNRGQSDTFLNNKTRVRGVQDVITRMKNSEDDVQAGDSPEDQEARTLLNKFIGSQVILSGMESRTSSSSTPSTTVKRTTTTTTTTSKGGGKPTVITRTFTHPITEEEIATVWDEQTLKLLLERSTDYEERQIIRSRIREAMAEQEVCADVVAKSKEESSGRIEGESLLLPLLQGLLDAPDNEQTADSGTESGEDLRSGLLVEVQNVLAKLANSLKSDTNEMTPEKRSSLLQLVARLQTGLTATPVPASGDRRGSGQGRFGRRRRQNRHTVGVSSEELEDARRLMAEFGLCDNLNSGSSTPSQPPQLPLQKQNSEGSVLQRTSQFRSMTTNQNKTPVKNAVAKPYGSSASTSQSHSGASSTVDTPEVSDGLEFTYSRPETKPPDNLPSRDAPKVQSRDQKLHHTASLERKKIDRKPNPPTETVSSNFAPEIEKKSVPKTTPYINNTVAQINTETCVSTQESETDEETVKGKQTPIINSTLKQQPVVQTPPKEYESNTNMLLQSNPIYSKPKSPELDDSKSNRFNSKKLKMKRANTIDIPKPLEFYESEDDYDSDTSMLDKHNSRRNNYLALRGPIRVGRNANSNNNLPVFEPKTDSDRKFMAFINKHSDDSSKNSLWAHKQQQNDRAGTNWNSRFGNIKTAFEKASTSTPGTPNTNMSSARNFWKSADDAVSAGKQSYNGPKVSKQGARNLQQMFEDKQSQQKVPWQGTDEKNVVTGSLKVDTKGFDSKKSFKVVPQPLPVNKFSHAPTSAFAAIPKKTLSSPVPSIPVVTTATQTVPAPKPFAQPYVQPRTEPPPPTVEVAEHIIKSDYKESDSNSSTPLYLYSPKPLQTSPIGSSTNTSPSATPWTNNVNEHRVQKLAASKFENATVSAPHDPPVIKPRKMSREKLATPLEHAPPHESLTAPYLVKSVDKASTVRKLSDQFDNKNSKPSDSYSSFTTVKYGRPNPDHQSLSNYQPQNYTITYANQKHQSYPPKHENEYQSYQKYQEQKNQKIPKTQIHQKYQPEQSYTQPQPAKSYQPQPLSSNSFKTKKTEPKPQDYQPQNYSVQYNQPQKLHTTPKVYQGQPPVQPQQQPEEYTSQQFIQFNQPTPTKEAPKYTSSHNYNKYQTKPKETIAVSDYSSPDSSPVPVKPQYHRQSSQESVKEYEAAVTRVMKGPVSHQAVTVQQKGPKGRDEHDMEAAFNLKSVLQKFSQLEKGIQEEIRPSKKSVTNKVKYEIPPERKLSIDSAVIAQTKETKATATATANLQRTQSFKKPAAYQYESSQAPNFLVNGKPLSMESTEINEDGESIITSKFHIPVTMSTKSQAPKPEPKQMPSPTRQMLTKSDSWHQLMHEQQQAQQKPTPKGSPPSKPVVRSKSSHTLAVPTIQFQAEKVETTKRTFSESPITTTQVTTKVTSQQQVAKKPMSPFAKFRQLDKQNSINTPPGTPRTPTGSGPLFKFTDPEVGRQVSTVKERLLQWCQMKTKEYENVQLDNFSSSWADGLAFCALIHHFLPDAFDYHALTPKERRHNFTLAFRIADEKADILPLLDVDDMVATRKPDWKCVFTYVQTIYARFKAED